MKWSGCLCYHFSLSHTLMHILSVTSFHVDIHRIGRTGRAGAKGVAHTFFTPGDKKLATPLVEILEKASQEVPAELKAMSRPRFHPGRGGGRGRGYSGGRGGRGYMSGGGRVGGRGGRGGRGGSYFKRKF